MGTFKKVTHFYCKNGKLSHVEPFFYDFLSGNYEARKEPIWVLFSYSERDPLSHQAKVEYVKPELDMAHAECAEGKQKIYGSKTNLRDTETFG